MLFFKLLHKTVLVFNMSSTVQAYLTELLYKFPRCDHKFNNFVREGFNIDALQKKSLDKLLKKLMLGSTQFFNLNYLNYRFIKFLIDDLYKLVNHVLGDKNDFSISYVIQTLFLFTLLSLHIILLAYFLISLSVV